MLKNLDSFRIKDIVLNQTGLDFSYLIGRNIFNLDLRKESEYISGLYPRYKSVRLVRLLPNRLFVGFTERKALAYVKLYRYFGIDKDLVLLDVVPESINGDLPVILGLETKIFGARPGRQYNIRELAVALEIAREARINKLFKEYRIKRIDVTNAANASFFIQLSDYAEGGNLGKERLLEVKVGQDSIGERLGILSDLLTQLNNDLGNIKYVDLRFKEPVVKFK